MIHDLLILLRLKWRNFKCEARYWLLVAYNPDDHSSTNRLYAVYLVLVAIFWLFAVWAFAVEQSASVGLALDPRLRTRLIEAIPWVVVPIQAATIVMAIRNTPLKLSAKDLHYLAASPVNRAALVWISFVVRSLPWTILSGIAGAWIAMTLTWPLNDAVAGVAGLQALLLTPWLSLLWVAAAWLVSALRYCWQGPRPRLWMVQVVCGVVLSGAMLGPGMIWQAIVQVDVTPLHWVGLVGFALAVMGGLILLGQRVNMIVVSEESQTSARLNAIGSFASSDLVSSIKKQARLAKRRPRLHLLQTADMRMTLLARTGLFALRSHSLWITWLFWGALMAQVVVLLVRLAVLQSLQAWTGLLLILMLYPPKSVIDVFQVDVREPYLRQYIPVNNLELLVWDAPLALPLIWLGAIVWWAFQMPSAAAIALGGVAFALASALVVLSLGIKCVRLQLAFVEHLSYHYAVLIGFGLPIVLGLVVDSLVVALIAGGAVAVLFARLIQRSQ